jgi:FkbM family methyltransferase
MRQALSKLLRRIARRLQSWSASLAMNTSLEVEYPFRSFSIRLSPGHLLPEYQRVHPLYDRFLPVLASQLEPGSLVIDVGANCGDTLVGMFEANPGLHYLCVEPHPKFFEYLESNVARIRAAGGRPFVATRQALIGVDMKSADLAGVGGTRHAVARDDGGGMKSVTLDALLEDAQGRQPRLIKSDVDGFDYDVIQSAQGALRRCQPLLFFECQVDTLAQKEGFEGLLANLTDIGYTDWAAFDNFGNLVLRTAEVQVLRQLLDYIWRQTQRQSTRTIYYLDILASRRADAALVDAALSAFLR